MWHLSTGPHWQVYRVAATLYQYTHRWGHVNNLDETYSIKERDIHFFFPPANSEYRGGLASRSDGSGVYPEIVLLCFL